MSENKNTMESKTADETLSDYLIISGTEEFQIIRAMKKFANQEVQRVLSELKDKIDILVRKSFSCGDMEKETAYSKTIDLIDELLAKYQTNDNN